MRNWCTMGGVGHMRNHPALTVFLAELNEPGRTWIKMKPRNLMPIEKAVNLRIGRVEKEDSNFKEYIYGTVGGDKTAIRDVAAALKSPGGLEKLGTIIASDFFVGSNDRFVYPPTGMKDPDLPQRFQAIQNLGNVFVSLDHASGAQPIGLDNFDPHSLINDPAAAVTAQNWIGAVFFNATIAEKTTFAANVIGDLEMALGPRNRRNPFKSANRLGSNRKRRLLNGIHAGEARIRHVIGQQFPAAGRPQGIQDRMALLGW